MIRHCIRKLANTGFVRSSLEEQADLSAFKEKPNFRVVAGLAAIGLSYLIGWPAIAALGVLAVKLHRPWLVVVGGPLVYGLSHLVFLLGMYLAGALYTWIFLRWLTRVSMEKLLAWAG